MKLITLIRDTIAKLVNIIDNYIVNIIDNNEPSTM